MKNQNLEHIIFDKLDSLESTPPEFIWENVEKEVGTSGSTRALFYVFSTLGIISLMIAVFYFSNFKKIETTTFESPEVEERMEHPESDIVHIGDSTKIESQSEDTPKIDADTVGLINHKASEKKQINDPIKKKVTNQEKVDKKKIVDALANDVLDTFVVESNEQDEASNSKRFNKTITIIEIDSVETEEHIFE